MGNRIIRESIRTSKSVNLLSDFQFRMWVYLITYVDDYGRGSADPEIIKGFVFPKRKGVTEAQILRTLDELATSGMIQLYEVGGDSFFCFPTWDKYQRIQTKKSKYPDPQESTVIHRESPPESVSEYESESISENESKDPPKSPRGDKPPKFQPPTLEEVTEYCRERNSPVDPKQFWDYFQAGGWVDSKGNKVKNWKQKLLTWEKYQPERRESRGPAGNAAPERREPKRDYVIVSADLD